MFGLLNKSLIKTVKGNKGVISNAFFLSIIEVIRIAFPFITLPYVIKTVGASNYGTVAFAQAIASYLVVIVNYGLNISAIKDVSVNRDNPKKINEIVSSVFIIKGGLFLVSFLILTLITFCVPILFDIRLTLFFASLICFSEIFFPVWYYVGIEKMKYVTLIQVSAILFYNIGVFIFIHKVDDYPYVALLYSGGNIFATAISLYLLFVIEKRRFLIPKFDGIVIYFKESTPFFLSRVSEVFNTSIAKILSGALFSMTLVAAFELAQKIASVAVIPMSMLNRAIYPNLARSKDTNNAKKLFVLIALCSVLISVGVFIIAPYIITYFSGGQIPEAVSLLRVLCLYILIAGLSTYTGASLLVSFGYPKPFNYSVLLASIVLVIIYYILYLFSIMNVFTFAIALVLAEFFIFAYRFFYCKKFKII